MIKKFTLLLLMVFVTIACYADKVTIADFSLSDNWSTDGTYVSYNTSTHVITSTKANDGYLQNWCEGSGYKASKLTLTTQSEAGLKIDVYYTTGTTNSIIANATSFELALDATRVIQKIMIQTTGIESTGITLTSVKLELEDVTKVNLALFDAGTGVTWNTGTLSATFPGSWGNNYIQDWSNLNGKYATKLVVTTAGAANYEISGKYTDETDITSSRIYDKTKCEVTLDPTKAIHWVKITCTNDGGESVTFTDAYLVPTYLSESTTPTLTDGSQAPVVLYRTITAGNWSTIVLPFDLPSDQITTVFGAGASVAEFTGGNESTLNFTTTLTDSKMKANQPYAIKVASDFSSKTISNVTIVSATPTQNATKWDFVGNYTQDKTVPTNSYYFKDNALHKATNTHSKINGFRGYFTYTGGSTPAPSLNIVLDGTITGIKNVTSNEESRNDKFYNLSGQQVSQPAKGIYIKNGKKYIIK